MSEERHRTMAQALEREMASHDETRQKLTLAEEFGRLLLKAYDALLHYGINFKTLRTYSLWEKVSEFKDTPIPDELTHRIAKSQALLKWIGRVSNDIDAALRRKLNIHLAVDNPGVDDE